MTSQHAALDARGGPCHRYGISPNASSRRRRILVLFPSRWDKRHFGGERYRSRFDFEFYGEELWQFPGGFFRILRFDPLAFIDRVVREFRCRRIDAVVSTDEYMGSCIAAAVAAKLGLPGADPAALVASQHKYYARMNQRRIAPEAVPAFQLMTVPPPARDAVSLEFPFFVKPARGSFSLFATRVDSYAALYRHLKLNALWRTGLKCVLRPYNELLRYFTGYTVDANRFIGEGLLRGQQVCVDGFVLNREVHILGVIDALMFPGTYAFERFQYPSQLGADVQKRIHDLVRRLVGGLHLEHGQFNVELVYDASTDQLGVIELHPRLSYQFADMYEDVDGMNTYDLLLDLAVGDEPKLLRQAGRHNHSASLVIRKFRGRRVRRVPPLSMVNAFHARHPDARVEIYARPGSMNPEMRAMGSYRCALINAGAQTVSELSTIRSDADSMLRFDIA